MAQISPAIVTAMNGGVIATNARDYYFLGASDITALGGAIGTALAAAGYAWGDLGTFAYQGQFDAAFATWTGVANFNGTRVNALPERGILVVAVTSGGLQTSTGEDGGVVLQLGGGRQLLVLNTSNTTSDYFASGSDGYSLMLHEIGHAMGLNHSFDGSGISTVPVDSKKWTVMSYKHDLLRPITPQLYDVGVIQNMYGSTNARAAAGSVYEFRTDSGASIVNGVNGQEFRPSGVGDWGRVTIWDQDGVGDTIGASTLNSNLTINLNEAEFSSVGARDNVAIAYGTVIENAKGGSGNDILIGNDVANELTGNEGHDTLRGGEGADTYIFTGIANEGGTTGDTIIDDGNGATPGVRVAIISTSEQYRSRMALT